MLWGLGIRLALVFEREGMRVQRSQGFRGVHVHRIGAAVTAEFGAWA